LTLLLLTCISNASDRNGDNDSKLTGTKPDPWVSAAPLVVAAVCSDGIALVALSSGNNTVDDDTVLQNREVLRIHQVDGDGTALLCAGWRTDSEWLANKGRSLVAQHVATFGASSVSDYLPQDMSLWMASCASSSSSARPLSVVGLLACANEKTLSLVDATGHYNVRAHAVGRGARRVNDEILRRMDFSNMTAQQGVDCILQELVELSTPKTSEKDEKESGRTEKQQTDPTWMALSNETTQVEVAFVNAKTKQLQRLPSTTRLPFTIVQSGTILS
jgi:hypothetical protein